MSCKIIIKSTSLSNTLGNDTFDTIEDIIKAFDVQVKKYKYLKFNTEGVDFTVTTEGMSIDKNLGTVYTARFPLPLTGALEFTDDIIKIDQPSDTDAGANTAVEPISYVNDKVVKSIDESPMPSNKVKWEKYTSTSVRDLDAGSDTFYDSQINRDQRQLLDNYRNGKYPNAKLVVMHDRKAIKQNPDYKGAPGVVGLLVNNPTNDMNINQILENAISKVPFYLEDPAVGSFFGADNTDETSRSSETFKEAVAVRNREQGIDNAEQLFHQEADELQKIRDYAMQNLSNFVIMNIDSVSAGSRLINYKLETIDALKLDGSNLVIDEEGKSSMTFKLGNKYMNIPVTGAELTDSEIELVLKLWGEDSEAVSVILGAVNKPTRGGFMFKNKESVLVYTDYNNKSYDIKVEQNSKEYLRNLLEGRINTPRHEQGPYKRKVSYQLLNIVDIPQEIAKEYNVSSAAGLHRKLLAPIYTNYKEHNGEPSIHPANSYFYLSAPLEGTPESPKLIIESNPIFDVINSRVSDDIFTRNIPDGIAKEAEEKFGLPLPPAFTDGKTIYVTEELSEEAKIEEKIHVLTMDWLDNNKESKEYKQLEKLHAKAVEVLKSKIIPLEERNQIEYSLFGLDTDAEVVDMAEFVARGISNPETVKFLQGIEVEGKTWFQTFTDLINSILQKLGLTESTTIYSELIKFNVGLDPDVPGTIITSSGNKKIKRKRPVKGDTKDLFKGTYKEQPYNKLEGLEKDEFIIKALDYEFGQFLTENDRTLNTAVEDFTEAIEDKFTNDLSFKLEDKDSPVFNDLFALSGDDELEIKAHYFDLWKKNSKIHDLREFEIDNAISEHERKEEGDNDFKDRNNTTLWDQSSKALRNFISILPEIDNNKIVEKYGIPQLANPANSFGILSYALAGSNTMKEMYQRLTNSNNTLLKLVGKRLPNPENINTETREQFWNEFYQKFRQTIVPVMTYKTFEEGTSSYFPETGSNLQRIKNIYQNNFIALSKDPKYSEYFNKDSEGIYGNEKYVEKIAELVNDKKYVESLELMGFKFQDATKADPEFITKSADIFKHVLKGTGGIKEVVVRLRDSGRITNPIAQLSVRTLEGSKSQGQKKRIDSLLNIEAKYSSVSKILTTKNANNQNVQANSLPNTLTQIVNGANDPMLRNSTVPEHRVLYSNLHTNLFKTSKVNKFLTENPSNQLQVQNVNGKKDEQSGEGELTKNLSDKDWTIMNVSTLVKNGVMEMLRQETASASWGFTLTGINGRWISQSRPIEDALEQYKDYFFAEIANIKQALPFENLDGRSQFKNYSGHQFNIFSEILEQGTENQYVQLDDIGLQEAWDNNVKARTEEYLKAHAKEVQKSFDDLGLTEADFTHLIDEKDGNKHNSYDHLITDFSTTGLIYGIEQSILFYGGLEHWSKFYKRNKGVVSTGSSPILDDNWWDTWGQGELSPKPYTKLVKTFILKEDEENWTVDSPEYHMVKSQWIESLKSRDKVLGIKRTDDWYNNQADDKLLGENRRSAYAGMDIADGQGYINLDFMRVFLRSVNNWSKKDEELYQWEVGYYKQVIHGNMNKNEYNKTKPNHAFSIIKAQYFGGTDAFQDLNLQIFDKFSLAPLIPSVQHNTKYEHLMNHMLATNTGYVKFSSATKAAANTNPGEQMSPVAYFNADRSVVDNFSTDIESYNIHVGMMKEQLKTNPKYKQENIYGSQFRKLLVQDMTYIDNKGNVQFFPGMKDLYYAYTKNLNEVSRIAKEDLYKQLGIIELGKNRVQIRDYNPLLKMMEQEAESRDLIKTVKDFIELNKGEASLKIPFEASASKQTLENLLAGLINKKLIRQKVNGAQLIQLSSTGFEHKSFNRPSPEEYAKYGATGLRYYVDGKAAQVKIAMSKNFKPLLDKYESLDELNAALKNGTENPVTIIGYRIPTQGLSSMDAFEIAEFLPESSGNMIITPPEIVAKSGADYDIDKMSFMFPDYSEGKNADLINERINIAKKILLHPMNYHHLVTPLGTDIIEGHANFIAETLGKNIGDTKGKIIEFNTHLSKRRSLLGAMRLLGVAATSTTFLQLYMKAGLKLSADHKYLLLDKSEENKLRIGNLYHLGNPINADGDFKSEIANQYVNGTVDAASNDFLGLINYTMENIGMIMYQNLVGVPPQRVMNFVNQPVIHERIKRSSLGQSNINENLILELTARYLDIDPDSKKLKDLIIQQVKTNRSDSKIFDLFEMDGKTLRIKYQAFEGVLDRDQLDISNETYLGQPINNEDKRFIFNQIAALVHYKNTLAQSKKLFMLQQATSPDTNVDRNPLFVRNKKSILDAAYESDLISNDSINKLIEDSTVSSFFISKQLGAIFESVFPIQYEKNFIELVTEMKKDLKVSAKKKESFLRVVANDFLLYKVIKNSEEDLDELYTNFYGELEQFRLDNPDLNLKLLNELYEGKSSDDNYSTIELRESSTVNVFKDVYTQNIEQLHDIDPKFTRRLIKAGFFQSGFNKTFFSWAEVIPPVLLADLIGNNLQDISLTEFEQNFKKNRPEFYPTQLSYFDSQEGRVKNVWKDGKPVYKNIKPLNRPLYTKIEEVTKLSEESLIKETINEGDNINQININGVDLDVYITQDKKKIGVELTGDQTKAVQLLANHVDNFMTGKTKKPFILKGKAGTGKSFSIKLILQYLRKKHPNYANSQIITMMHKAGKVASMATYGNQSNYKTLASAYSNPARYPDQKTLLFDEVSMNSEREFKKVINDAKKKNQLLFFIGDIRQLPPINEAGSKVSKFFEGENNYELEEVVRFKKDGLIFNIANTYADNLTDLNPVKSFPKFQQIGNEVVSATSDREEFIADYLNTITLEPNLLDTRLITYSNKSVKDYNDSIRNKLFRDKDSVIDSLVPYEGEPFIGKLAWSSKAPLRNPILNSSDYVVMSDGIPDQSFRFKGKKIIGTKVKVQEVSDTGLTIPSNIYLLDQYQSFEFVKYLLDVKDTYNKTPQKQQWFSEANSLLQEMEQAGIYSNEFIYGKREANGDITILPTSVGATIVVAPNVQYGYAITTHNSQGSSYKNVFVDEENLSAFEKKRKVYTREGKFYAYEAIQAKYVAMSRATTKLAVFTKKPIDEAQNNQSIEDQARELFGEDSNLDERGFPIRSLEEITESLTNPKDSDLKGTFKPDFRFSKLQISDKLKVDYNKIVEKHRDPDTFDFDQNIVFTELNEIPGVKFDKVLTNELGEDVGLLYFENETNPTFKSFGKTLEGAKNALLKDKVNNNLPNLNLSQEDINNIKNCNQ